MCTFKGSSTETATEMGLHFVPRIHAGNLVFPSRGLGHRGLHVPVLSPEPPHRSQIPTRQAERKSTEPRPSAMQLLLI